MKSSSADMHTEAHMIYVKDEFALIISASSQERSLKDHNIIYTHFLN